MPAPKLSVFLESRLLPEDISLLCSLGDLQGLFGWFDSGVGEGPAFWYGAVRELLPAEREVVDRACALLEKASREVREEIRCFCHC